MVVALLALFVALAGTTWAATGGNFVLGQPNTAKTPSSLSAPVAGSKALQLTNTDTTAAGSTALGLSVAGGHPPLVVNSSAKVANLNADWLDGSDSTAFLRKTVPLSLTGSAALNGVISGTNTGSANGLQGRTGSPTASGVYGENTGDGFGVAGRSNGSSAAVYGENSGGGYGVSGVADTAGVNGISGSSNGVQGDSAAGGASGVYGHNSAGGFGVAGRAEHGTALLGDTTDGWALDANGNTTQNRDGGGLVKAMAYINPADSNDPINQCYNSQLPPAQATSGDCGITFNSLGAGTYKIGVGFNVHDRFVSVTPAANYPTTVSALPIFGTDTLELAFFDITHDQYSTTSFYMIIF